MLQAMNTGHEGSLATIHGNNPRDVLARLENMISMAGLDMPVKAMRSQIASAIHLVIQLNRLEDGSRRIVSIQEIEGMEGDIISTSEIFKYTRVGVDEAGALVGHYSATGLVPKHVSEMKRRGIKIDMGIFNHPHPK